MPLPLPLMPYGSGPYGEGAYGGSLPFTPLVLDGDQLLSEARVTAYRFDLLGRVNGVNDILIGELNGVQSGGYVDFTFNASIKGGGKITVVDIGQSVDWLNVRIRPVVRIGPSDTELVDFPVGVFLPTAPTDQWDDGQRTWDVELLDKLSILDQDVPTDPSGAPLTYALETGTNIIDAVIELIESVNESAPAITRADVTLSGPMTWDVGTSKLVIINDLLAAANYFSIFCDGLGQYQAIPYVEAVNRPVSYEVLDPFSASTHSLMAPTWNSETDIYSIPNRYVAIGVGDEETEALVAVASNVDPASPYSYPSRGRWITQVATGVEAAGQAELDGIAQRSLALASSASTKLEVTHAFLPDLHINGVIHFTNPDADLDIKATVTSTNIPFNPVALCSTKLGVV